MADVIPFVKRDFTMNMEFSESDGFTCMICGHWLYESETEWGDLFVCNPVHPKRFGHMHGRESFHFCPNCGAQILSPHEWADFFPHDQGKTVREIAKRYYKEVD